MKTNTQRPHRNRGFSLIELLIAMGIIGILASIAYPSYQNHIQKTNRTEGQNALLEILARQQNFFSRNMTYTTDLTQLDYANDPVITDDGLYSIAAATCNAPFAVNNLAGCVRLTATAQGRQLADGNLTINSAGAKAPANRW